MKIAYLLHSIQCNDNNGNNTNNDNNNNNNDNNNNKNNKLVFWFFIFNFATFFGFICLFSRRLPSKACIIYFSIKRRSSTKI